jgi:outer membrane scaffolding protein for murein synthesis (MipA/OmpV family)
MTKTKLLGAGLAATAAMMFSHGASAQEVIPLQITGETNLVGLGIFSVPDFYGSDKQQAAGAPLIHYNFDAWGNPLYVQVIGPEIRLNVVPRKDLRAGPLIRWRSRRDDDVDDEVVKRMRPIASATEVGAFVAYHMPLDANPLHKVVFTGDVTWNTNNVYDGATGNVRATYFHPFPSGLGGKPLLGSIGFGLFFASDHFVDRYFGVHTDRNIGGNIDNVNLNGTDLGLFPERNGIPYRAEGGLTSIKIPFSLTSQIDPNWLVIFGGRYEHLLNDAKDSPIVQRRGNENQWTIGIAATYAF